MASHEEAAMSDTSYSHTRFQEYTYRLPTPPRIIIPPPTLAAEIPDVEIERVIQPEDDHIDVSFLNNVDFSGIVQRNALLEWSYERRRQAQMILPFLYLGPMVAAKDKTFLAKEGITMLLAVRPGHTGMVGAFKAAQEAGVETDIIEVPNHQALIAAFPRAVRKINEHLSSVHHRVQSRPEGPQMGKVLVFCESGNERSAAVVAAYLMEMLDDIDYIKAMQLCQAQRFCVNFDDALKHLLQSYWDILIAKRSVAESNHSVRHSISSSRNLSTGSVCNVNRQPARQKRTLDVSYEDDMDIDDSMDASDEARFLGREFAPFQDKLSS
ncbi:phosphatases II [Glonium stellatum]|uniref:Phosphatases II n=1 Tax=Glonium stellatum TaxID=574774 RepID=A0A8E2JYU0_9PEZI|nr:phosphatases II [Glonium stellatum]